MMHSQHTAVGAQFLPANGWQKGPPKRGSSTASKMGLDIGGTRMTLVNLNSIACVLNCMKKHKYPLNLSFYRFITSDELSKNGSH